jgi:diguanylate cyclase (GGDEF)-like protein
MLLIAQVVAALILLRGFELPSAGALVVTALVALAAALAGTVRIGERGHLGLAAVFVPTLIALIGPTGAAILAALASALSDRLVIFLEGQFPDAPPERRLHRRRLHDLLGVSIAVGAAGIVLRRGWNPGPALLAAALILSGVLLIHELASRLGRREAQRLPSGPALDGLLLIVGGAALVGLGGPLRLARLSAISDAGFFSPDLLELVGIAAWAGLLAGLALALSAQQRLNAYLKTRLSLLDAIGSAPRRLGSPRRRQPDVVSSAIDEIGRLVDFDFLQLELRGPGRKVDSVWSARRGEPPGPGPAAPPAYPPPRPGIHRRRAWTQVQRTLMSGSTELGTLRLWCDPRRQDKRGLEVLDHLAEQVGALLERSLLAREARFDRLTGLPRRGIFDDELQRRWILARDRGEALSVVLLDVDFFKAVNDGHGHPVGDQALIHVANVLAQVMREEDLCCRYGGEEFVLLLTSADGTLALEMAERARLALAGSALQLEEGMELALTLSCGCASVPETLLRDPADLVGLADEALYAAKSTGRNRSLLAVGGGRFRSPSGKVLQPSPSKPELSSAGVPRL